MRRLFGYSWARTSNSIYKPKGLNGKETRHQVFKREKTRGLYTAGEYVCRGSYINVCEDGSGLHKGRPGEGAGDKRSTSLFQPGKSGCKIQKERCWEVWSIDYAKAGIQGRP